MIKQSDFAKRSTSELSLRLRLRLRRGERAIFWAAVLGSHALLAGCEGPVDTASLDTSQINLNAYNGAAWNGLSWNGAAWNGIG